MNVQTELNSNVFINKVDADQLLNLDLEKEEIAKLELEAQHIQFKPTLVWKRVLLFIVLHVGGSVGLYQLIAGQAMRQTCYLLILLLFFGNLGLTAGVHRLWSHRSYKATLPLRIFLMIANCLIAQGDIIDWSRDHRCHHKWMDTNADPHNTKRGFFFAHMGWLITRKHPQIKAQGAKLDLSDLYEDPVCVWQRNNYLPLVVLCSVLIPTAIPVYFWKESISVAFPILVLSRLILTLHATSCINSFCHWIGFRPYDASISPAQAEICNLLTTGEGHHNYHHVFPQDYRTSEIPCLLNLTKGFIDICAKLGLAYDLNVVRDDMICRQAILHGDGNYKSK